MTGTATALLIWAIALLTTVGVLIRPFRAPEAVWAVAGAGALVVLDLLPLADAGRAVLRGADVYLFLIGMMLLSEVARREGLFDGAAAYAVRRASGSPKRLFLLVYAVGVVVTTFLSNDATAVVLTPAVFAATRKARVDPMPYLFVCAFIANAASFVLPISNPANLVLYADHMPPLGAWLASFALPSAAAIGVTFAALRWTEGARLEAACAAPVQQEALSSGGWAALGGLALTVAVLLTASALNRPLGVPTAVMGALTLAFVSLRARQSPLPVLKGVSWSVLPLVAGLFVIVEALDRVGLIRALAATLVQASRSSPTGAAWGAGGLIAVLCNLTNNLPAGLIAGATVAQAHASPRIVDALLIGVDLGPNLSITGSLATLLWLIAIRREGVDASFWRFAKVGVIVMPPALILALAARLLAI
jgi:arsenical pump membrane protein